MTKFQKFDQVIGLTSASEKYSVSKEGWVGTVWGYTPKGQLIVSGQDRFGKSSLYHVDEEHFGLQERLEGTRVKYLLVYEHLGFSIELFETVEHVKERVAKLTGDVSINRQTLTLFEVSGIIPATRCDHWAGIIQAKGGDEGRR